jgi:GNAT superfamily N-acetyltransferase
VSVTIVVRTAVVADAAAIAAVHVASWRSAYRGIVPDSVLDRLDVEKRTEGWRAGLRDAADGDLVAVALVERRVCGFVRAGSTGDDETAGEIHAIYVDPQRWGEGIGGALLGVAEQALADRGLCHGRLWAFSANHRARRWYETRGWRRDGAESTIDLDGTPVPEVRYTKKLPAASR